MERLADFAVLDSVLASGCRVHPMAIETDGDDRMFPSKPEVADDDKLHIFRRRDTQAFQRRIWRCAIPAVTTPAVNVTTGALPWSITPHRGEIARGRIARIDRAVDDPNPAASGHARPCATIAKNLCAAAGHASWRSSGKRDSTLLSARMSASTLVHFVNIVSTIHTQRGETEWFRQSW